MSIPDVADLVVIAARVLEIDPREALDLTDLPAAEAALARARNRRGESAGQVAAALLAALIRHRPLAAGNRQGALPAGPSNPRPAKLRALPPPGPPPPGPAPRPHPPNPRR